MAIEGQDYPYGEWHPGKGVSQVNWVAYYQGGYSPGFPKREPTAEESTRMSAQLREEAQIKRNQIEYREHQRRIYERYGVMDSSRIPDYMRNYY